MKEAMNRRTTMFFLILATFAIAILLMLCPKMSKGAGKVIQDVEGDGYVAEPGSAKPTKEVIHFVELFQNAKPFRKNVTYGDHDFVRLADPKEGIVVRSIRVTIGKSVYWIFRKDGSVTEVSMEFEGANTEFTEVLPAGSIKIKGFTSDK